MTSTASDINANKIAFNFFDVETGMWIEDSTSASAQKRLNSFVQGLQATAKTATSEELRNTVEIGNQDSSAIPRAQAQSETLENTLLGALFPEATDEDFCFGQVNDSAISAQQLRDGAPEGYELVLASGSRLLYAKPWVAQRIAKILPSLKDRAAYASLFLGACQNATQETMKILVVDDVTGENGDHLPTDLAKRYVADCYGQISARLANTLIGNHNQLIQYRMGLLDQDPPRIAKGTFTPRDLERDLNQYFPAGEVPDLIVPLSSFKGGDKSNPILPGTHTILTHVGVKGLSEHGKISFAQGMPMFHEAVPDFVNKATKEGQQLASANPRQIAALYCKSHEELKASRQAKQQAEPLSDSSNSEGSTGDDSGSAQRADPAMYSLIKAIVDNPDNSQLDLFLTHPKVVDTLNRYQQKEWTNLATGAHYKFPNRCTVIADQGHLREGEICYPNIPFGKEILTFRAPILTSNGIGTAINTYSEMAYDPDGKPYTGVVVIGSESISQLRERITKLAIQGHTVQNNLASDDPSSAAIVQQLLDALQDQGPTIPQDQTLQAAKEQLEALLLAGNPDENADLIPVWIDAHIRGETFVERLAADYDGDTLGFVEADDPAFQRVTAAVKIRNRPENAYARVEKQEKLPFAEGVTLEDIALIVMNAQTVVGIINNHLTAIHTLTSEMALLEQNGTLEEKRAYVKTLGNHYSQVLAETPNMASQYRKPMTEIIALARQATPLTEAQTHAAMDYNRVFYRELIATTSYQNQVAVDMYKSSRQPDIEEIETQKEWLHRIPDCIRDKKKADRYTSLETVIRVGGTSPSELMIRAVNELYRTAKQQQEIRPTRDFNACFPQINDPGILARARAYKTTVDKIWRAAADVGQQISDEKDAARKSSLIKQRELLLNATTAEVKRFREATPKADWLKMQAALWQLSHPRRQPTNADQQSQYSKAAAAMITFPEVVAEHLLQQPPIAVIVQGLADSTNQLPPEIWAADASKSVEIKVRSDENDVRWIDVAAPASAASDASEADSPTAEIETNFIPFSKIDKNSLQLPPGTTAIATITPLPSTAKVTIEGAEPFILGAMGSHALAWQALNDQYDIAIAAKPAQAIYIEMIDASGQSKRLGKLTQAAQAAIQAAYPDQPLDQIPLVGTLNTQGTGESQHIVVTLPPQSEGETYSFTVNPRSAKEDPANHQYKDVPASLKIVQQELGQNDYFITTEIDGQQQSIGRLTQQADAVLKTLDKQGLLPDAQTASNQPKTVKAKIESIIKTATLNIDGNSIHMPPSEPNLSTESPVVTQRPIEKTLDRLLNNLLEQRPTLFGSLPPSLTWQTQISPELQNIPTLRLAVPAQSAESMRNQLNAFDVEHLEVPANDSSIAQETNLGYRIFEMATGSIPETLIEYLATEHESPLLSRRDYQKKLKAQPTQTIKEFEAEQSQTTPAEKLSTGQSDLPQMQTDISNSTSCASQTQPTNTTYKESINMTEQTESKAEPQVKNIVVYTDGSCPYNQGKDKEKRHGGWGVHIEDSVGSVHELQGYIPSHATSPRMELEAVINPINWLKEQGIKGPITIKTDSEYAKECAQYAKYAEKNGYVKVNGQDMANIDLRKKLFAAVDQAEAAGMTFTFEHVIGHSGVEGNKRADKIATTAAAQKAIDLRKDTLVSQSPENINNIPSYNASSDPYRQALENAIAQVQTLNKEIPAPGRYFFQVKKASLLADPTLSQKIQTWKDSGWKTEKGNAVKHPELLKTLKAELDQAQTNNIRVDFQAANDPPNLQRYKELAGASEALKSLISQENPPSNYTFRSTIHPIDTVNTWQKESLLSIDTDSPLGKGTIDVANKLILLQKQAAEKGIAVVWVEQSLEKEQQAQSTSSSQQSQANSPQPNLELFNKVSEVFSELGNIVQDLSKQTIQYAQNFPQLYKNDSFKENNNSKNSLPTTAYDNNSQSLVQKTQALQKSIKEMQLLIPSSSVQSTQQVQQKAGTANFER